MRVDILPIGYQLLIVNTIHPAVNGFFSGQELDRNKMFYLIGRKSMETRWHLAEGSNGLRRPDT